MAEKTLISIGPFHPLQEEPEFFQLYVEGEAVVRCLETFEAIKIIKQCIRDIPDGPIDAGVEHVPPGEGCGRVEAPRGEAFHYIRSDGSNRPACRW